LTKKEFELLVALVNESPRVVDHRELFAQVWDSSYDFDVNYVRIFVGHLRKKIEPDRQKPTYIHNERGVGYRFLKQD
jgi:two-component system KDP operon response regulator KdpE